MDAHLLNRQGVTRLCYAGSVLHTLPLGAGKSRQPFQVGAEIYGHAGLGADIEIQQLMIDVLRLLGVEGLQLDIGHPAIFRSLIASARISAEVAEQVFAATEAKDTPSLRNLLGSLGGAGAPLLALPALYGGAEVLTAAASVLPEDVAIKESLKQLAQIQSHFASQNVKVCIDLGELGGFNYESGVTFSVYAHGAPDAIARGGRYDEVGKAFGRARPATGFSMDLRCLLPLTPDLPLRRAILGPKSTDPTALIEIERLRATGEIVVARLPGHEGHADEISCDRKIENIDGRWVVIPGA
jgi:ATP phosphoribosyltransferase regulatory subunit